MGCFPQFPQSDYDYDLLNREGRLNKRGISRAIFLCRFRTAKRAERRHQGAGLQKHAAGAGGRARARRGRSAGADLFGFFHYHRHRAAGHGGGAGPGGASGPTVHRGGAQDARRRDSREHEQCRRGDAQMPGLPHQHHRHGRRPVPEAAGGELRQCHLHAAAAFEGHDSAHLLRHRHRGHAPGADRLPSGRIRRRGAHGGAGRLPAGHAHGAGVRRGHEDQRHRSGQVAVRTGQTAGRR